MSVRRGGKNPEKFARALVEALQNKKSLQEVIQAFETFLPSYQHNAMLRAFMENPLVPTAAKRDIVDKIPTLPPLGRTFLKVILDAGGEKEIQTILSRSIDLGHASLKRIPVRVTSAIPLSPDVVQALEAGLKEKLQSDVILQPEVDPSVIGGVRLVWNGKVLDGTIPGRLHRLEKYLLGSNT